MKVSFPTFLFNSPSPSNLVQEKIISTKQKQRTKQLISIGDQYGSKDYPLDLWYIIAMYIPPEDIGKFSLICRASNYVVHTVYFWMRLFRK